MGQNERTLYLALGSNLGETKAHLERLRRLIADRIAPLMAESSVITTQPEGFESQHLFANQVVALRSDKSAMELLDLTQAIEKEMGRTHKSIDGIYHDRVADVDLIMLDDEVIDNDRLTLPHPRFRDRPFVLNPLVEIAPDLIDPITGLTVRQLHDRLQKGERWDE